ncbi:DUF2987 domain-containing protein, partial [Pseudoalteromonas sp. S1609]|uniref:DUF2987 domain-containing protein n=1 Tax=Pseudoalteromonas sp. S1609 TaxID=579505 RepID=UPI00110A81D9
LLPCQKPRDHHKAVSVAPPKNPVHDCQLKVQIEANERDGLALSKQALLVINNELEELLTDVSGFFGSKLM